MSLPNHICSICGREWDDKQSHLCTDGPTRPAPRTGYTPCDWPECDRSPADGWALLRVNPTGQKGIFMCSEHAGRSPEEVADVMDAVAKAMSTIGSSS